MQPWSHIAVGMLCHTVRLCICFCAFWQAFRADTEAWMVPVIIQTAENLRLLAYKADEQLLSQQQPQQKMEEAGSHLQKFYGEATRAPSAFRPPPPLPRPPSFPPSPCAHPRNSQCRRQCQASMSTKCSTFTQNEQCTWSACCLRTESKAAHHHAHAFFYKVVSSATPHDSGDRRLLPA